MEFRDESKVSAKRGLSCDDEHVRRMTNGIVAGKRKAIFGHVHYMVAFKPKWPFGKVGTIPGLRERDLNHWRP